MHQNLDKMSIGKKIIQYRRSKNLSQNELADLANVGQSMISTIESDKSKPNSIMLNRIAKALDVDINELLSNESIVQNNSDQAIGNIHSQVTINNHFSEKEMEIVLSNQEKITKLLETQNNLLESVLKK